MGRHRHYEEMLEPLFILFHCNLKARKLVRLVTYACQWHTFVDWYLTTNIHQLNIDGKVKFHFVVNSFYFLLGNKPTSLSSVNTKLFYSGVNIRQQTSNQYTMSLHNIEVLKFQKNWYCGKICSKLQILYNIHQWFYCKTPPEQNLNSKDFLLLISRVAAIWQDKIKGEFYTDVGFSWCSQDLRWNTRFLLDF